MAPQRFLLVFVANAVTFLLNQLRAGMGQLRGYVLLDIKGTYPERRPTPRPFPMRLFFRAREEESVEALRERLDAVAADPRTEGVILRIGHLYVDLATAHAIREAIARFRSRGKRVVAYFTTDIDLRGYYAASSANQVIGVESAHFVATGLSVQVQFLKDALARWGLQVDMEAMGEYKTAGDIFTRADISEPHREMLDSLLDTTLEDCLRGMADSRDMPAENVRRLMDEAPFNMERAQQERLIDAVLYEDKLPEHLQESGSPAPIVPWRAARFQLLRPYRPAALPMIAVVSVQGMIVPGESRDVPTPLPFVGGAQAGAETVVRTLRQAERAPGVKAIVCYVNSPGGSALASDLIWREVRRVSERKPVVACMGAVAASGGYYVAAGARHIVAHPQTLTGSIGVLGGKLVLQDLYRKAGIHPVLLTRGRRAALFTGMRPFEDSEREAVREMLTDVYRRFKDRVALGRGMEEPDVEERARGRVWTGRQAMEQRLVDELGDLHTAVERAKALAGVAPAEEARVVNVAPPPAYVTPWQGLKEAGEVLQGARPLDRDICWAILPWRITIE